MWHKSLMVFLFLWEFAMGDLLLFETGWVKFKQRRGRRQHLSNIEHIDADVVGNATLVILRAKNIENLYPKSVRNLQNLRDLSMVRCSIQNIFPDAFSNVTNLTTLQLQDNLLEEIKLGVFNDLPVKLLSLQRNIIRKIAGGAFDDMPNLFRIKLNSNKLKTWDSDWFKRTPKLTELYFKRNRINYLPPSAFANLNSSHLINGTAIVDLKIFLSKNKLSNLNNETFNGMKMMSQLWLDRNGIAALPAGVFRDLEEIEVLYLARNKIREIDERALPKVRKIGILDLCSNLLECLPYSMVSVANLTNLEKTNVTCACVRRFQERLSEDGKKSIVTSNEESQTADVCPGMIRIIY